MLGKNRAWKRVDEWLSAYIDGALSPRERARLEDRLAQDADLRARLESLRQTVALVRGMPPVPAPRNFLLTPAMVQQPAPMVRQPAPAARRLAPALTFATAVSGLLCVILLVGNLMTAGWGGPGAAAPAPMGAYGEATAEKSLMAQNEEEQNARVARAEREQTPLPGLTITPQEPVPEMIWGEEAPHPLESAPPGMGGGGAAPGPDIGGGGGAAALEPPSRAPYTRSETAESPLPTATPGLLPPTPAEVTAAESATPSPSSPPEPEATTIPVEFPGEETALPISSWLPVGGLALMTAVLAVLSIRAWRAR